MSTLPYISVVIPCMNEAGNIIPLHGQIHDILQNMAEFEIIYVDDGSSDHSAAEIVELCKHDARVHLIQFTRNFGHQAALIAGIQNAKGNAVVMMDADGQHPPALLPLLIKEWQKGFKIVNTKRADSRNTGLFKKLTSHIFYQLLTWFSGIPFEPGIADYRLIDKAVVELIKASTGKLTFLRGWLYLTGYKQQFIGYECGKRLNGKTKYNMRKMCKLAFEGIASCSTRPLYLSVWLGFFLAFCSFVYGIYAVIIHLFTSLTVSGWSSIVATITLLAGVQLIITGIIGYYVGKVSPVNKAMPQFVIENQISGKEEVME